MTTISQKKTLEKSTYIAQGEYAIGDTEDTVISTILGSCVATCLWDPVAGVGGMNHFLLPDGPSSRNDISSFGANAMELLINALTRAGAVRGRIRAKVFGGAEMYKGLTNAGNENGVFVLSYLQREGIPCDSQSLGGVQARRIEFMPALGKARQKLVADSRVIEAVPKPEKTNDIELF
ncbi:MULTISPECIES: chemotaxis protein CheD [Roseobacteraceae]|uniref:Probable chemoreceptor glutamine deamidase CheD n=1 Tax=Celeribacter baekdonensis B30 TaxID=1208323 RepID=K2JQJ0_9RHOB|nr:MULTISPECIES: chemotaxis protein CheD [Roseobacteraceae]EKE72679.1 chemoreceptor glutamine deamidase CheD [Celeribacter baekdonensis B30]KAB6715361.1 chemotaxis protein CheD [Roseobacter sp. TSBP12]|tara:strand:+ start:10056 stop:10589 length:534 start_codon:yes stop_codon:yes gene_type:complete